MSSKTFATVYYQGNEPTYHQIRNIEDELGVQISLVGYLDTNGAAAFNVYSERKPKTMARTVAAMLDIVIVGIT